MQLCGIKVMYLLVQFFGEVDVCMNLWQYFCTWVDVESPAERPVTLTVDKNSSRMISSYNKYENQPQYGATSMEIPHEFPARESPLTSGIYIFFGDPTVQSLSIMPSKIHMVYIYIYIYIHSVSEYTLSFLRYFRTNTPLLDFSTDSLLGNLNKSSV